MPSIVSPSPANQPSSVKGQPGLHQAGKAGRPSALSRSTSINGQCLQPQRAWADGITTGSSCDERSANQFSDGGWQEPSVGKRRRLRSSQLTAVGSLPKQFQQVMDSTETHINRVPSTSAISRSSSSIPQTTPSSVKASFASTAAKPVDPRAQQLAKQQFILKQNHKE